MVKRKGNALQPQHGKREAVLQKALRPEQSERAAVLRKALRDVLRGRTPETSRDRERRRWMSKAFRAEQVAFLQGIAATANQLAAARDRSGEPIYPTDARHGLLAALERIGGWPSIAELARAQRVSKQAAREQVIEAARVGLLELLPDPYDRRAIQVGLTASGQRELAGVRARQFSLVTTLLNGLEAREMRRVGHVLSVIRNRLIASFNHGK